MLGLLSSALFSRAQVLDSSWHEFDSVIHAEIHQKTPIQKLWDTTKQGVISSNNNDRQTFCIELTDDEHCCFSAPCRGLVTSNFGWRGGRLHAGVDIDLEVGDPVYAAFDGIVRQSGWHNGYGNFVIISHFNGLETLYGHLSSLNIGTMQPVKSGQIIGLGGNTGKSYGSHLHFEVRYYGKPINPKLMIDFKEYSLSADTLLVGEATTFSKSNIKKPSSKPVSSIVEVSTDTSLLLKEARYDKKRIKDLKEKEKKKAVDKKKEEKRKKEQIAKAKGPITHTIKKGDTLYALSLKYKVPVETICKWNKLKPTDILSLGMKVRVK